MSELVYPLKLPVVSSLPPASVYTHRMVVYDNKVYFSDGTQWIELGANDSTLVYLKYAFFFGGD